MSANVKPTDGAQTQRIIRQYRRRLAADGVSLRVRPEALMGEGTTATGVPYSRALGLFAEQTRTVTLADKITDPGVIRSTLEHEAVHSELHHAADNPITGERQEWLVDHVAAVRLMPVRVLAEAFAAWLLHSTDPETSADTLRSFFPSLRRLCEVDEAMLRLRLEHLDRVESGYVAEYVVRAIRDAR